jgi:Trk K+ transport system NAD-binding subunit
MRFSTYPMIYLRFLRSLLWEFRWSLGLFWGLVLLGGLALQLGYDTKPGEEPLDYVAACNHVFFLMLAQVNIKFPSTWYLRPLFFLLPIIGLGAVADSLVRLGYLVFASKQNLPEWQRMIAASYRNHIIVVGLGKVGYRIIHELMALHEPVVAIDLRTDAKFTEEVQALGVPIIQGNARSLKTLEQAGVAHARSIILATNDDLANLDVALTAQKANSQLRVVLRLFDDSLAEKFTKRLGMSAIGTAQASAQAFIAAATDHKFYHNLQLYGSELHLADMTIQPGGSLVEQTVGELQAKYAVNIVMHRGVADVLINPPHSTVLGAGDTLLMIAPVNCLKAIEKANQSPAIPNGTRH